MGQGRYSIFCLSIDHIGKFTLVDKIMHTLFCAKVANFPISSLCSFIYMFILSKGSVKGRLMVHISLGWFIKAVRNGHIKRVTDEDIQSSVLEIMGVNVNTSYVTCPTNRRHVLAIKLPFLVMIIKNLKKFFSFEVEVLDDKNMRRRFRASNYQVWIKCMLF